jgi:hypothetical protein
VDPESAFQENPDPIRIQGFDGQKLREKKYGRKFFLFFFDKKLQLLMSKLQEKPSAPLNPDQIRIHNTAQ